MSAPLQGIKVVEMAEVMQGPFAAQLLADYGAEVIKVERATGDLMRGLDRDATAAGRVSAYFAAVNRNKRSVVIDLKSAEGSAALHQLLDEADVFVHSYRPDAIRRLGLAYDDVSAKYPALVYASASGWGESGPASHRAGQDLLAQSVSGMARTVGKPSLTSHLNPIATVDHASGSSLAQGVLAALLQRVRTGRGQHVSVNLLDSALSLQMLEAAARSMYDAELNWVKQWWSGEFETADGYLTVVGFFRENAVGLACKALGMEDLSVRPEFEGAVNQAAAKEEINRLLTPMIKMLTTAEAESRFDSVDLLCSPMLTLAEAVEHPQVRHNDPFVRVRVSGQQDARVVGRTVRLSDMARPEEAERVPLLGEDTESVLARLQHRIHEQNTGLAEA